MAQCQLEHTRNAATRHLPDERALSEGRAMDLSQRFRVLNRVLSFQNHLAGSSEEQP